MDQKELMAALTAAAETPVSHVDLSASTQRIKVDMDTRKITGYTEFGVIKDHLAENIIFKVKRYKGDTDLAEKHCAIHWENGKNGGVVPVTEIDLSEDGHILMRWELSDEFTQYAGSIAYALHFFSILDGGFTYHAATNAAVGTLGTTLNASAHSKNKITPSEIEVYIAKMNELSAAMDEQVVLAQEAATKAESIAEQLAEKIAKVEELTQKTEINKNDISKLSGDLVNYGDYLERSTISELQENLLNGVTIYKGKNIDGSGREPLAGDPNFCYTDYIVASPRQMYYFVGRGYIFYEFYDINKKHVRGSYRDMGANIDTLSAISPDEARFLRLSFDTRYAKRPQVINNKIRNLVETVEKLNTEKMLDFYSFNFIKEDLLDTFSLNINNGYCEYDVSYYCTPFMKIPINAIKVSVTGYNLGDNGLYKQIVFYDKDYNYISGTFDKDEVSVPKNAIYVSCSFGKRYFENVKIIAKKENKENIENSYNKKEIDSKIDSVTLKVTNSETEMSLIDSKISSVEDKLDVERKRIDNFTSLPSGSTSGDAELQDIRVGVDGVIYPNAGEAVRKQIQATQNQISEPIKTMYRYLMVSFGYDAERLSLLGSDDLETFYLINKNAYNMTKGRTNRFRDPAITQIGKYYYIVYSDGFTDSTKLYMCRTVNFVDYEELEPIDITNADGSESIVIWAPCWFRHDGKLYVILNSDSGLRGTWYGEYDYITHTVSPTSKFNFKDYPQTIDVHIYYENNYFYAIVKDESKYYDSLHILKSDSLSGEFVSVGNNLQAFGYAEGQFAIRLDNGKIRIFAVELGLENIPIKYADLDTFESEPSEIKAIKYVGIDESYKLSHATYWDFNKFGSGYGLLG